MKCNNACSWKGCRVHKTDGTNQINMEFPKLFLCEKHTKTYYELLKNNNKLAFGKTQLKRYIK